VSARNSDLRRGLYLAPFDELADPRVLVGLAMHAEEHGWDGMFLWDHIRYRPPVRAVADPWVALSAIAAHTEQVRLGPLVTPLSRRRVHKVGARDGHSRPSEPRSPDPRRRARQRQKR
jgi:alkanesulfonate monooxygenase SsuD/methylene tetrahydromethanopterin reductase-like flavin-dependent oxidoreductase (luciferase family)